MIKDFKKVLLTEFIKKKRSGIFYLSIIIGSFIPLFTFISKLVSYDASENQVSGLAVNYYEVLFKGFLDPFALFLFPLVIIITASKITRIDHKNKGWEFMEVLPVSKLSIYFSKYLILLTSNVLTILAFLLVTIISGLLFAIIYPPAEYINTTLPFLFVIKIGMRLFIAGLCITAFQYALSVIIKSYLWPLLVGFFCLLLIGFINLQDNIWYPYYFLNLIQEYPYGSDFGKMFIYTDWLSLVYTILFLYIGYNWYAFKGFVNAFFTRKKNVFKVLGVITFSGVLIAFILKPNTLNPHNKTVITGTVESNVEFNEAFVLERFTLDTIAKINIKNGVFKTYINKNISLGEYHINSDRGFFDTFILGNKDSINIDMKIFNKPSGIIVNGTRIAENLMPFGAGNKSFIEITDNLKNNLMIEDAAFFMEGIYENWQEELSEINLFRSVDNIVPREDFVELHKKKISVKHLQEWRSFKKKRKVLFPNIPYKKTEDIIKLENSISLTDKSLLTNTNYLNLVSQTLIENDERENVDESTKLLEAIEKLPESQFKNSLLFNQLKKVISLAENTQDRDSLITRYAHAIKNENYKALVLKFNEVINKLSKGSQAPDFLAYNIKNEMFNLSSYAGNYLLIDVWATWCGICKQQAPYFENKALKYKDKPIKFVSMNMDETENTWKVAIKGKNSSVQQLRVKNRSFGDDFNIWGLPAYILIDPEGKYVNADFLRPSSNSFDTLLEQHLKGLK